MGFFEPSVMRGHESPPPPPNHNFVVIAPMTMKFGTGIELDVFYTVVTKKFVTSLLLRNYDIITCQILLLKTSYNEENIWNDNFRQC